MATVAIRKESLRVWVRWMCSQDMPAVLGIECASFEHPWTEADFLDALRHKNCIGMVAENGPQVLGFMLYELYLRKLVLLNFAVHPQCRHREVGSQMIGKLINKLSSHRRRRIIVDVLESSLDAQLFFKAQEFRAVKVLRGFFSNGEDAYRFQYKLKGS